jgi:hypothetical protein
VIGMFATGSKDTDVRQPVTAVAVAEVYPPDPYAHGVACETSQPFAVLSVTPVDDPKYPRILAVWTGASPEAMTAPDTFIIAKNGRAVLGMTSACDNLLVELPGAGETMNLRFREMALSGQFGPSFETRVVVPKPDGRERPKWEAIFK